MHPTRNSNTYREPCVSETCVSETSTYKTRITKIRDEPQNQKNLRNPTDRKTETEKQTNIQDENRQDTHMQDAKIKDIVQNFVNGNYLAGKTLLSRTGAQTALQERDTAVHQLRNLTHKTSIGLKVHLKRNQNTTLNKEEKDRETRIKSIADTLDYLHDVLWLVGPEHPKHVTGWGRIEEGEKQAHIRRIRRNYRYRKLQETWKKDTAALAGLGTVVKRLCDTYSEKTEKQRHYTLLEETSGRKQSDKVPDSNLPTLVVYRHREVEKQIALDSADFAIQQIQPVNWVSKQNKETGFAVFPEKTAQTYILEMLPYSILLLDRETIETAGKLYAESKLSFQNCVKLSRQILKTEPLQREP